MLELKRITKDTEDLAEIRRLYVGSFPAVERAPLGVLLEENDATDFYAFYDGGKFCGFFSMLTYGDITHLLFFAVREELRGMGYGTAALGLIEGLKTGNRIIVDIETPEEGADNNAQRVKRKKFYLRAGYAEAGIKYCWRGVDYEILIKRGSITESEFNDFWDCFES